MTIETKRLVEAALYGSGDRRRFTLDSPILSDVWAQLFERPGARPSLLLEPWLDTPASAVVERLREAPIDQLSAAISYNRTVVVADLSLRELIGAVLPLTGWYREIVLKTSAGLDDPISLPRPEQMWDDLAIGDGGDERRSTRKRYALPRLLGFIRMAGLILCLGPRGDTRMRLRIGRLLTTLAVQPGDSETRRARDEIAKLALHGWRQRRITLPPSADKIIYGVSRNRPARLAIQQSVRTVKGDAAGQLFSVDCGALTWAILDSGIDADHPAFERRNAKPGMAPRDRSRVRETYDFSYLRELLAAPDWSALPRHIRVAHGADAKLSTRDTARYRIELLGRIRRARQIDWELLKPFVRVSHDGDYIPPADPHGTHVAGILAADWDRDGDRMIGMCPAINLIDMRVTRADGTSDEFIIMSALQFVRHLNANSDRVAVHGVNMSLSLEHDAAVYACGQTPVCEEAERTVASGVVVVVAAGNHGHRRILAEGNQPFDQYCPVSITDPGNAENVITVGSTHRLEPHTYGVSYFSSRGPTGDGRVKPDLVAPGEKIYAPAPGGEAMRLDGTSMAAPHVSGAAAMLMARHVELVGEPQRIKAILCSTATDLGREPYFQGRGLVDVLRAMQSI